jgi:arylamine N-acetyltransferase
MSSLFSLQEIDRYLAYLGLPETVRTGSKIPKDVDLLKTLQTHQISKVPFENLGIHYSKIHNLDINPRVVYQKVLAGNGRGGQCMELNLLLTHILRGLGFYCYTAGAKVRIRVNGIPQGEFMA